MQGDSRPERWEAEFPWGRLVLPVVEPGISLTCNVECISDLEEVGEPHDVAYHDEHPDQEDTGQPPFLRPVDLELPYHSHGK